MESFSRRAYLIKWLFQRCFKKVLKDIDKHNLLNYNGKKKVLGTTLEHYLDNIRKAVGDMASYRAGCNPPKGKKGYTTNFRHPVIKDKDGKYGMKVHRGLSTSDENEANELVDKLNELMSDDYWWDLSKRAEAYSKYNSIIVDAFYDPMDNKNPDETDILNKVIMPSKEDGYTKAIIMGPSGAGKTSLVRLLCGTIKEKYPTTSSGRTTTCEMEMIMSDDGMYEVVVTFMSRGLLEMYVQECIENAFYYGVSGNNTDLNRENISDKLFIHRDLIVRLSYILGDLSLVSKDESKDDEYDDYDIDDDKKTRDIEESVYEYKQDIPKLLEKVNGFVDCLIEIINKYRNKSISLEDETLRLEDDEDILSLRDDIVNEVQLRFNLLVGGEKLNSKGKWVNAWYFKTESRDEFIKVVKRFSSNAKNAWGGLLTPIVRTMRVKGNFKPEGESELSKIILFDGQGLGHKTTATSIPLETIDKFKESDSIIIVDNAQAPLLDNVKIALKSVIESGAASKLLMCYTHVDMMKGDNFNNFNDKRKHVVAALSTYLMDIKKQNSLIFSDIEESEILNSCYYLSELDKSEINKITRKESGKMLEKLREHFRAGITIDDVTVHYDAMTLYTHLQIAIKKYRTNWGQIIGYPSKSSKTEHWSRIKALTRRLAYYNLPDYNNELMPLSDFAQAVREQINIFLNKPLSIDPEETDMEVKVALINLIKGDINAKLAEFIRIQMWQDPIQMKRWEEAYCYRERYSTYYRSVKVNEILELAAPQIDNFAYNMTDIQKSYVMQVMNIVEEVIETYGGKLERFNY